MAELTEVWRRFLAEVRFAVLATTNPDGSPQQTVMWYVLDGDRLLMNTARGRQKDRNLLRDQRVSVCVEDGYRYLTLAGTIAIDDDPVATQDDIRRLATRYHGLERADEMMFSVFGGQQRVSLWLTVEKVDAHGFDDEG